MVAPRAEAGLLPYLNSPASCVRRPSYDTLRGLDDSEPGIPYSLRRTPRENGMNYFCFGYQSCVWE